MPRKSRWSCPIPEVSLPTHIFGPPGTPLGKYENQLAFADADRPETHFLTWGSYRLWSQRFAAGLIAAGLQPGDVVVSYVANDVLFPVLFMGVCMAGAIFSPANGKFLPAELAHQLQVAKPRFILATDKNVGTAQVAAKTVGLSSNSIFIFDDAPLEKEGGGVDNALRGVRHWKHLVAPEEVGARFAWDDLKGEASKQTSCAMVFSSGFVATAASGLRRRVYPKASMSHTSPSSRTHVRTNYVMDLDRSVASPEMSSRHSRWLCCLPMAHGLGLCYFGIISPSRRVPAYIMKEFNLDRLLNHVQNFRITELHLVPPMLIGMTKHPGLQSGRFDLSSVTKTFSCAAPLGPAPTRQFEALWPPGKMNVKKGLASSETACNTIGWDPTLTALPGSVGEPMPNVEIKLVGDDGNEVPDGTPGEIWARSPKFMTGYWNNPKATAETMTEDGWLRTGDVAVVDENGYYFVVDRKKEMIKVLGVQVAPAELEALLLDHPKILDAGVIGVKKGEDELPRAYVVPHPSANVSVDDIHAYINSRVSGIKRLTGGIVFTDAIPRAPSGKIPRRVLRERATKESQL